MAVHVLEDRYKGNSFVVVVNVCEDDSLTTDRKTEEEQTGGKEIRLFLAT